MNHEGVLVRDGSVSYLDNERIGERRYDMKHRQSMGRHVVYTEARAHAEIWLGPYK